MQLQEPGTDEGAPAPVHQPQVEQSCQACHGAGPDPHPTVHVDQKPRNSQAHPSNQSLKQSHTHTHNIGRQDTKTRHPTTESGTVHGATRNQQQQKPWAMAPTLGMPTGHGTTQSRQQAGKQTQVSLAAPQQLAASVPRNSCMPYARADQCWGELFGQLRDKLRHVLSCHPCLLLYHVATKSSANLNTCGRTHKPHCVPSTTPVGHCMHSGPCKPRGRGCWWRAELQADNNKHDAQLTVPTHNTHTQHGPPHTPATVVSSDAPPSTHQLQPGTTATPKQTQLWLLLVPQHKDVDPQHTTAGLARLVRAIEETHHAGSCVPLYPLIPFPFSPHHKSKYLGHQTAG